LLSERADLSYSADINRDEIIAVLRGHEPELRRRGVAHVALFGSSARLEAGEASNVDILVEITKEAIIPFANPRLNVGLARG
jgi:predicted nucleotidyltransferase